jgi:agmatine deiminase
MPTWVRTLSLPLLERYYPLQLDLHPPTDLSQIADFLARRGLLVNTSPRQARLMLENTRIHVECVPDAEPQPSQGKIRVPAQWETMESVLIAWSVLYPPLWELHAQIVEAITPVCDVSILVPTPMWASAIYLYLCRRGVANLARVRFLHLPTDDMWVRDYGAVVGVDEQGELSSVYAHYRTQPNYPQQRDEASAARWSAYEELPARRLDLHTEGGNLWTDGEGTLIMSEQVFRSNPHLERAEIERRLHEVFVFEKLMILPRLRMEETGHIDLVLKLANANTLLMSKPLKHGLGAWLNDSPLRSARRLLEDTTNARGERYTIHELPALPMYFNWGVYPIWRTYTNSLTVNGRVLVPVYGVAEDEQALDVYRCAMPEHAVIGIDCKVGINGGGAVHCLTREIPMLKR